MAARHGAGAARLVRVRAAMRLDAGGDSPRDRRLALDGRDLRLHAGARLCRGAAHQPDRPRGRRGIVPRQTRDRRYYAASRRQPAFRARGAYGRALLAATAASVDRPDPDASAGDDGHHRRRPGLCPRHRAPVGPGRA